MKLIPVPKKITEKSGTLDLTGLDVAVKYPSDGRLTARATDLKADLEAATEEVIRLYAAPTAPGAKAIYIEDRGDDSEAYTLEVTKDGVLISGSSAAGAFYGMQTLRQMIKEYGKELPLCKIEDEPSFTRSQMVNTQEEVQTVVMAAQYLGSEYTTRKILTLLGDGDQADEVLRQVDAEDAERLGGLDKVVENENPQT